MKIKNIEDKITNLATDTNINAKINEGQKEIPSITNTVTITVAENKILNVSNLVRKIDYNTKTSEFENKFFTDQDHDKYITTQNFIKLTSEKFTTRLSLQD